MHTDTHRAKIELSYTRTMRDRLIKKTEAKVAEYNEKIARLEEEVGEDV